MVDWCCVVDCVCVVDVTVCCYECVMMQLLACVADFVMCDECKNM